MKRASTALLLLAFACASARADVADPTPDEATSAQPVSLGESYALPIMGSDAVSVSSFALGGFLLVGAALGGDERGGMAMTGLTFIVGGMVSYAVAPPLLHLSRGNPRGAMRSAAARTGIPLAGAMIAYLSDRQSDASEQPLYGLVAGVGLAMLLDWTLLSRMPAGSTPFVAPTHDAGIQAGIGGRF